MENSLCILLRHPPYGQIHAAEAIRHMGARLEGIETSLVLVDDGVYVARDEQNTGGTNWTPLRPRADQGDGERGVEFSCIRRPPKREDY